MYIFTYVYSYTHICIYIYTYMYLHTYVSNIASRKRSVSVPVPLAISSSVFLKNMKILTNIQMHESPEACSTHRLTKHIHMHITTPTDMCLIPKINAHEYTA